MSAEREIIVKVRLPSGTNVRDVVHYLDNIVIDIANGNAAGEMGDVSWELAFPPEYDEPMGNCRMCGAGVAWSPICSACCGVVERVEGALEDLGGAARTREICAHLASASAPTFERVSAALLELRRRERILLVYPATLIRSETA